MAAPPYGAIADLLKEGQVVPFLGAGVNFRPAKPDAGDAETKAVLPVGAKLSESLADGAEFPSENENDRTDLAKVTSYYVETIGRKPLRARLHEVFAQDYDPCDIHNYLAEIDVPLLIVTTNYDDLTERAFVNAGHAFDLVIHPTDHKDLAASVFWKRHAAEEPEAVPPNKLDIDLESTTVIYKMHGSVDREKIERDSYVITEEDYVEFLSRMTSQTAVPAIFMEHFYDRHFLFLGYGLRDWNFRVVLNNLRSTLPEAVEGAAKSNEDEDGRRSWAIQHKPSELDKELWNARKVKIYDVDINEFVRKLREHRKKG